MLLHHLTGRDPRVAVGLGPFKPKRNLDNSVPHNSLPERLWPLGSGVARNLVSTPRPARPSRARASEPGRTSWLHYDWFDPESCCATPYRK